MSLDQASINDNGTAFLLGNELDDLLVNGGMSWSMFFTTDNVGNNAILSKSVSTNPGTTGWVLTPTNNTAQLRFRVVDGDFNYNLGLTGGIPEDRSLNYSAGSFDTNGGADLPSSMTQLFGRAGLPLVVNTNVTTNGPLPEPPPADSIHRLTAMGVDDFPNSNLGSTGAVGDLRIWDHAVPVAVLESIYHTRGAAQYLRGLVGHWPMDFRSRGEIATPSEVRDVSGSGAHGQEFGEVAAWSSEGLSIARRK